MFPSKLKHLQIPMNYPLTTNQFDISMILLVIVLPILTFFFSVLVAKKQIITLLSSLGIIKPISLSIQNFHSPHKSIIRNPEETVSFEQYVKKDKVFNEYDIDIIDVVNNIDTSLRIVPTIKINIIKFSKITDLPVILLPEPNPWGMGGGGDQYDHFQVELKPEIGIHDAELINVKHDFYNQKPDDLQSFSLHINYAIGYYFWYKIGIDYFYKNKRIYQWGNKIFFGGKPLVMRVWYYHEEKNKETKLIETDSLYTKNLSIEPKND